MYLARFDTLSRLIFDARCNLALTACKFAELLRI